MAHKLVPTVYVRVSTDPAAGGGHLSRMLALRQGLKGPVKWFVDPGTKSAFKERFSKTDEVFEEAMIDSIVKLQSIISADTDSLIICDSYRVSYEEIAAADVPAVYFDDNDVQSSSDNVMIVNCQPRAKACKNCLCQFYNLRIFLRWVQFVFPILRKSVGNFLFAQTIFNTRAKLLAELIWR